MSLPGCLGLLLWQASQEGVEGGQLAHSNSPRGGTLGHRPRVAVLHEEVQHSYYRD